MAKSKKPWGEVPCHGEPLHRLFHAAQPGECKSFPLSVGFLKEVLACIPPHNGESNDYTKSLREILASMKQVNDRDLLNVKVTEFVLIQKDIARLFEEETSSAKTDKAYVRTLRDVRSKLGDMRLEVEHPVVQAFGKRLPVYTNDQ